MAGQGGEMERLEQAKLVRSTLIVLLLIGLALLLVPLASTFLLIFAAILIACLIRAVAIPFQRAGVPETPSVLLGLLTIVGVLALSGWLFGAQLGSEFGTVAQSLPGGVARLRAWVATVPFAQSLLSVTPDVQGILGRAASVAFGALGAVTNLVLVIISAIYLALEPGLYAKGIGNLFPRDESARVREALTASGDALRKYLLAQFVTMIVVGTLCWIGLAIVGVPAAGALGLIVGLTNFVPLIGPFIGAVPGILLAFGQGPETAMWAAIVYFIAQQIEGNVLTPMVQRWAVSIPPALLLFALAGLGSLFGVIGVILAAPLAVVLYVLVTLLWSRDALGHEVGVPGIDGDA